MEGQLSWGRSQQGFVASSHFHVQLIFTNHPSGPMTLSTPTVQRILAQGTGPEVVSRYNRVLHCSAPEVWGCEGEKSSKCREPGAHLGGNLSNLTAHT